MSILKRILLLGTAVVPILTFGDFQLVKDGKAEVVIVLSEKATRSAQLGAYELQHHVKLMTGAELPIIRGKPVPASVNIIRIGGENSELTKESNKIMFTGKTLLLTGNDSPVYWGVDYENAVTFPNLYGECKGSLFAVYDFLELYCGVRFYGMDETGTTYRQTKDLAVKENNRNFTPRMDAFRFVYDDDNSYSKFKFSRRDRALWQLRWRMSVLFGRVSHNQASIYFAYWDKANDPDRAKAFKERREDFFAQGYAGKYYPVDSFLRSNYPNYKMIPPQICYSSKGAISHFANEVLTYFNGGNAIGGWMNFEGKIPVDKTLIPSLKGIPFFYPIEGADNNVFCACENCQQRFPEDNNISNNKFQFIADVAREAAKTNPEAGVATLAYIQTYPYPDQVTLPENVSVQLCPTIYSWWHPVLRQKQITEYRKWVTNEAQNRPLTLWTYLFSTYWDSRHHYTNYKPFPGLYPWQTGKMFKMFAEDGIRGWFTETEMQYNHLEAYVAAKICYDPSLDYNRILDEYFTNYYGDAGPVMKAFYVEIEEAYWNPENYPQEWFKKKDTVIGPGGAKNPYWGTGFQSPDVNWALGTPERMKKLNGLIEQAKKLVKTENEKIRLQRIIDGFWNNALQGERDYQILKMRRLVPPRRLALSQIPDSKGDLSRIDWDRAVKTEKWGDYYGNDVNSSCSVQVAADSEYLYLRFHEDRPPKLLLGVWNENIEYYFNSDNGYPVYQVAVTPDGTLIQNRYEIINEIRTSNPYDFRLIMGNMVTDKSWTVLMAVPWKSLPLKDTRMSLNFMRTTPGANILWNPIYTAGYINGINSFGFLDLYPKTIQENGFRYHVRGVNADVLDDSAASNGKAAYMLADKSWSVQYMCPKNFIAGKYKVSIALRTNAPPQEGLQSTVGVYDTKLCKVIISKPIPAKTISGKDYTLIEIGACELNSDRYLYLGGFNQKIPDAVIYADYMQLDLVKF